MILSLLWLYAALICCRKCQDINLWIDYSNVCGDAISNPKENNPYVKYFGEFRDYKECQQACIQYTNDNTNQKCQSYTYFQGNTTNINNTLACYGRLNDPQFCPCKSDNTVTAEIYWPCNDDMDCSLNGICQKNGTCLCRPQWKGKRCQLLNLLPVKKDYMNGDDYWGFASTGTSSWGGSVLIDDQDDNKYHMFLSYFPNSCGHIADTMNSHVHHAISTNGYKGPYIPFQKLTNEWSHEPFATRGPNGEYVVYLSYANNLPYWPNLCNCTLLNDNISNGTTPITCCENTPNACSYSKPSNLTRHTTVMRYTNDINSGEWSDIQYLWPSSERGPSNSDTNFVCKIFNNGTVLGYSRRHTSKGTNVLYFVTATQWNDTSTYIEHFNESIFPQWAFRGNEDPFIFNDENGYYHLLFHNEIPDPGHDQYFAGAHAASYDGYNWTYFGYAYDTNITFIEDGSHYILHSRERPHLVFDKDGVTPLALTNGVLTSNNTYNNDRSITFLQPINQLFKPLNINSSHK